MARYPAQQYSTLVSVVVKTTINHIKRACVGMALTQESFVRRRACFGECEVDTLLADQQ